MDLKTLNFKYVRIGEKLSSFRYSIPKNKKELMYDFYILSALPTWGLKTATTYERDADELKFVAEDTLEKVCNYLQRDLLDAVYYAICCEFRHYFAFANVVDTTKSSNWPFFKKYLTYLYANWRDPHAKPYENIDAIIADGQDYWDRFIDTKFFLNQAGRDGSNDAIKSTGVSREKMVAIAENVFNQTKIWYRDGYGGESWAAICRGWKKLNAARGVGDQVVYIDHVFDLQHNTDTVLNKCKDYADDNRSHEWIGDALDDKKRAKSLFDLTNKCTPSLKYFAARVIKAATGETFESYTKKMKANAKFRGL